MAALAAAVAAGVTPTSLFGFAGVCAGAAAGLADAVAGTETVDVPVLDRAEAEPIHKQAKPVL
jgi:hypothetical protein